MGLALLRHFTIRTIWLSLPPFRQFYEHYITIHPIPIYHLLYSIVFQVRFRLGRQPGH